jgi:CheY-like chemotaxis protein
MSLNHCEPVTDYPGMLRASLRPATPGLSEWMGRFAHWCVGVSGYARPRPVPIETRATRATATVLVVEDDASLRELVRRTLEENGYSTLVARHGGEAMRVVREHEARIDLLITGVTLKAAGARIAAYLMQRERPGLKVLFVSRDVAAVTGRDGLEVGAAYLASPFGSHVLLRRVRAALSQS